MQTYGGATTVEAGTLSIGNSLGGSMVTVAAGATLAGDGIIGAAAFVADGGHLAPGDDVGTLTFSHGLTLAGGAIMDFQLGAVSDLVLLTGGALTGPGGDGDLVFNLFDAGSFAAGTYLLFDFAGATDVTGFELDDFVLGMVIAGFDYEFAFNGSTLELTASVSAVPEPATYALLAGAMMLVVAASRRRARCV